MLCEDVERVPVSINISTCGIGLDSWQVKRVVSMELLIQLVQNSFLVL